VGVYLKAAVGAVPGAGRLPFVASGGGAMPDLELEERAIRAQAGRVADYARVCGFRVRDELPPTVEFRKPILLPGRVDFERSGEGFRVRSGDKMHLLGRIRE
jgi:hypothetical protein